MASPSPMMEFLGRVAFEAVKVRPLLPTYFHLLISAVFPIYMGAHASLSRPSSAALPEKKKRAKDEDADDEDDDAVIQKMEGLSPSDAITFPLLAGATLASLYFILKWLEDPAILNKLLGYYFAAIGMTLGVKFVKDSFSVWRSILLPAQYSANGGLWRADNASHFYEASTTRSSATRVHQSSPLPGFLRSIPLPHSVASQIWAIRESMYAKARLRVHLHKVVTFKCPVDLLDLSSLLLTAVVVIYHTFVDKPWWLTNFLGFSFSYGTLQFMSPTTAWTGTLILSALFFYDIYFVFFTPMMVTVATKLDVPIKLLFPRPDGCLMPIGAAEGSALMEEYLECLAKKRTMAMLGLGDVVIPGMMIAFALRFDLYRFYLKQRKQTTSSRSEGPGAVVSMSSDSNSGKAEYLNATGGWGERFWTSRNLESAELTAKRFPKTYFYASLIGYLVGMTTTLIVMQVFEHAQPALLYLVPGVLASVWGTALVKGDLKLVWNYSEASEEEEEDDKGEVAERKKLETTSESNSNVEGNSTVTSDQTDQDKTATEDAKDKDPRRELISFSITLPPAKLLALDSKVASTTDSDKITTDIAEAMSGEVSDRPKTNGDAAALPDVEANDAVFSKLARSLTEESSGVSTVADEQSPGKRRKKA